MLRRSLRRLWRNGFARYVRFYHGAIRPPSLLVRGTLERFFQIIKRSTLDLLLVCREFSEIMRARPDCDRAVNTVAVAEELGERNHLPSRCCEFDFFTVMTLFEQWVDQYEPPKRPLWLVSGKWCIIHSVQLTVCDDETWSTGIQVQRIDEPASFAKELGRSTPVFLLTYLSLD